MFGLTSVLVRGVFGRGRGDAALLGMPVIPAAVLIDLGRAGIDAASKTLLRVRRWGARTLRSAAERLDAAPVASPLLVRYARLSLPVVAAPEPQHEPIEPPVYLVMPAAAQETSETDYRALVKEHGSVAAAARHLAIPVSTLRGRLKKQG